ncbi:SDR family oxidoreductase [Aureimonas frigidaquae]|uniref:Short-chain dehydrogenase/reductase SDR n=1 Tax=Aureimonas frigidaquae TaxID=424757 RepID=A0A0P0Z2J4_9HYPH|nr:SDR family oxidoreductase [Aureimonas frigidaquae]BAT28127.1 short-chain dehydrogenase/reductase SDR [Aureimonas frigidaquae]
MAIEGRRVLVTGAGKGIGRATAVYLAEQGAKVVAVGRNSADLESLESQTGCSSILCELADMDAVDRIVAEAGPLDDLVNCAGTTTLESALEFSPATFEDLFAVNVRAPMALARDFARQLIDRGDTGAIVNVSSIASSVGIRDHLVYCATKGALDAATRVMALEFGPHGIRVNSVNPVVTLTPMAVKAWSDEAKSAPMLARIPTGRFVEPVEVAQTIAWLIGPHSGMINGVCLPVDGGFTAV